MVRIVVYLVAIVLIAMGLGWLADRPGVLQVAWQGYEVETTVFRAAVMLGGMVALAIFLWSVVRALWHSPAVIGQRMVRRRQRRGLDALSGGLIAIGAGDGALAQRYAVQARKTLPHEPLTHLLRARTAELSGDRATARRIYEAMLQSPETEQLGLRGLFLEAEREGANDAAKQFAERSLKANPKLQWSANALFDQQCKQRDWAGAIETLDHVKKHGLLTKAHLERMRAVLLTARALECEEDATDKSLTMALQAHGLAPDLVPAAALAGRILASRGQTGKAAKVIQKTWSKAPHPDLAAVYAYARVGDSPRDRLDRIRQLAALNPHSIESPIAVATTAVEARMFDEARFVLEPLLADRLTQRVATLMARVEAGENGEKGRVREWLARAVNAAKDPVWLADGVISDHWEPISPVDGKLDAFHWRVPVETRDATRTEIMARRLEELIAIGAPPAAAVSVVSGDAPPPAEIDAATAAAEVPAAAPVAGATAVEAEPVTVPVKAANGSGAGRTDNAAIDREPVTVEPVQPAQETKGGSNSSSSKRALTAGDSSRHRLAKPDNTAFTAPPQPDDPGTDEPEPEVEQPAARRSFRAVN